MRVTVFVVCEFNRVARVSKPMTVIRDIGMIAVSCTGERVTRLIRVTKVVHGVVKLWILTGFLVRKRVVALLGLL